MKFEVGSFKYDGEKKVKKKKQKMEFSKKILFVSWLSGSAIILFACFLTYMMVVYGKDGNVELIAIILTGGFAQITAGVSFYFWKSRSENIIKLSKKHGVDTVERLVVNNKDESEDII